MIEMRWKNVNFLTKSNTDEEIVDMQRTSFDNYSRQHW